MIPEEYLSDENLDKVQMGLAASGMVPGPTGIASDVADAGISIGRGDLLGALLAGGAAIPGIGMAFGARGGRHLGKLGRGGGRSAMDVHDIVKAQRARHTAEEADEARKWRNVEESEIENADQFLHPEELELRQNINAGDELEESMTAVDMDESLIAEIGDGLQKHGVEWKEAVEKGNAELQQNYNHLMNMQEGGEIRGLGPDIARIEAIAASPDHVAEFALNRLDGQSFEEAVENTITTIQANELPYGAPPRAVVEQSEQDLVRQMTEGDEMISEAERLGGEEDFPYPFREPPTTEGSPDPLSGLFEGVDLERTTHPGELAQAMTEDGLGGTPPRIAPPESGLPPARYSRGGKEISEQEALEGAFPPPAANEIGTGSIKRTHETMKEIEEIAGPGILAREAVRESSRELQEQIRQTGKGVLFDRAEAVLNSDEALVEFALQRLKGEHVVRAIHNTIEKLNIFPTPF